MNCKFVITLVIVQSIVYTVAQKQIAFNNNNNNYDDYDCDFILSSMKFFYNQRCVQFIIGDEILYSIECIKRIMENAENVTFYMRSLSWLFNRNIRVEESSSSINSKKSTKYCENFLFVLQDALSLQTVLKGIKKDASVVTLLPYTKLYFMFVDQKFLPSRMLAEMSEFFYENAHFGYAYEMDAVSRKITLRDLLSPAISSSNSPMIQTNLIHPFVNRQNNQKEFRLSFFNCSPFIIYVDEERLRFDGIEYRLVQEVVKNWKVEFILRDLSKTGVEPWIKMRDDLKNQATDLTMCSIWMSEFDDERDLSAYYNHECGTFLVPRPKRLSEITAIYRPFSGLVWLIFALLFLATGILLWGSAKLGIVKRTAYTNISRAFLELINIATSHGVNDIGRQKSSIKMLLMSWIIACMSIGICYLTIYTSRLSKPGYTKLIDTAVDFIENDMFFGTYGADSSPLLNASFNPAYQELNRRMFHFKNPDHAEICLATGKFGVYASISNNKYFVTFEWNEQLDFFSSFRLMKKVCIFNFYTVFGLQKFSPYTELFSHYAIQFQEHGITQFWFSTVYRDKASLNTFFEDHPQEKDEPVPLQFASISAALLILFVCHIFSIVIFTCELASKFHCSLCHN